MIRCLLVNELFNSTRQRANDAVVDQWLEGSIWGILGWQKLGSAPATVRANVRFTLDKTSTFTIKRADADEPPEDLVAMVRTLH
jgi:hypothetical protein